MSAQPAAGAGVRGSARPGPGPTGPTGPGGTRRAARRRTILDLVGTRAIGSQEELAGLLRERGYAVTQATVSRDIADLGLVKAARGDHHAYVTPQALAGAPDGPRAGGAAPGEPSAPLDARGEARLRRILADYPVTIARSGLTLVLVSRPGAASAIAQAIDESSLDDQLGTLAGDNTLLVLFADEPALERWRARFDAIAAQAAAGLPGTDLTSTYP
jgi:transcriptional regulator of arginine metabolism